MALTTINARVPALDMDLLLAVKLLLLLTVANGAPILAHVVLATRWEHPIDAGRRFFDGRPLLGPSKTWRGLVTALLATPCAALLMDIPMSTGLLIAGASMAGDMLSSFCKRRLRIEPSGMALGLDQIPESLLPLLAVQQNFALEWMDIALLTLAFMIMEMMLSRIFYFLRIRKHPY